MALITRVIPRKFSITIDKNKIALDDPNPNLSIENVKDLYTTAYPQLLNAQIQNQGIINDELVIEFVTIAGTKG